MAQIDDLLNQASEIRDAEQDKENTALRVGTMLVDILQYIAGFVSVEGLQAVLADYAPLQGALVHWRNSRVVCLASMGTDLDNIDGGDWQYTNHAGDIVFDPSGRYLSIVGEQGHYSVFPGVFYVNLHSRHCYVWDATTRAMIETTDSSRPTIIDYRNNPPFDQVAIGESYYFESGSAKKIAIKTSSSGSYSFDPDPKKIYVFKDTCESMIWNATTRSWIAIGKNIEVVDNLTEGGRNKALSAEMGKELAEDVAAIPNIAISVVDNKIVINTNAALSPRVIVGSLSSNTLSCRAGQTATATFKVSGRRLTAAITAALSDTTYFSISPASISPSSGIVEETTLTVTYNPGSGATAGTVHNCTITISSGGVTYGTLELTGTVAAAPSLTLTPASLAISAESGQQGAGTINVKGTALDADVTLTLSGSSYMSFEAGSVVTTKTIAKASAMTSAGVDVTIYYTGTASDSGTITASSTGATDATAGVIGSVATRLAEGDTITKDGMTFTVLADTTKVSVKATSTSLSGNVTIPSSVQDTNGFSYAVMEVPALAFKNCTSLTDITIPDSVTTYGIQCFENCQNLVSVALGSGATNLSTKMFLGCSSLTSIVIPDNFTDIGGETFNGCTSLATIQIGTSTACAISNMGGGLKNACCTLYGSTNSALRTIICYATTPPSFGLWDTDYGYGLPIGFFTDDGTTGNGTLKVPASVVSDYQTSSASQKTLWSKIPTIQAITE